MLTRKTQFGLMASGGVLCLLTAAVICQLREGGRAVAQDETPGLSVVPADPTPAAAAAIKGPPPGVTVDFAPEKVGQPTPTVADVPPPASEAPKPTTPTAADPPLPGSEAPKPTTTPPAPTPPPPTLSQAVTGGAPTPPPPPPIDDKKDPEAIRPMPQEARVEPAPPQPIPPVIEPIVQPIQPVGLHEAPPTVSVPPPAPAPSGIGPVSAKPDVPEPPLAPAAGPIQVYVVRKDGETLQDIGKRSLPVNRVEEVYRLNPHLKPDAVLCAGVAVKLPGDACMAAEDVETVKPLPILNPAKGAPAKPKTVLPLTGTFPCNLDDKRIVTLPRAVREQLGGCDTLFLSPGPDQCLWLTCKCHLDRLEQRLEQSQAREIDVRVFKRLYFAQTEKTALSTEGRIAVSEKLAQFAGLAQEVILIGADDHFEVWDAARWKQYTQQKSAQLDVD
jgi:MraZ protein